MLRKKPKPHSRINRKSKALFLENRNENLRTTKWKTQKIEKELSEMEISENRNGNQMVEGDGARLSVLEISE